MYESCPQQVNTIFSTEVVDRFEAGWLWFQLMHY
jgi:hypothetical protein